jgi:hypothetical protein
MSSTKRSNKCMCVQVFPLACDVRDVCFRGAVGESSAGAGAGEGKHCERGAMAAAGAAAGTATTTRVRIVNTCVSSNVRCACREEGRELQGCAGQRLAESKGQAIPEDNTKPKPGKAKQSSDGAAFSTHPKMNTNDEEGCEKTRTRRGRGATSTGDRGLCVGRGRAAGAARRQMMGAGEQTATKPTRKKVQCVTSSRTVIIKGV